MKNFFENFFENVFAIIFAGVVGLFLTALVAAAAVVAAVPLVLYEAYVLQMGWLWFVVPLGTKALAYWHAAGLALFIGFLVYQRRQKRPADWPSYNLWEIYTATFVKTSFGVIDQIDNLATGGTPTTEDLQATFGPIFPEL